jgi:hypothetical protein
LRIGVALAGSQCEDLEPGNSGQQLTLRLAQNQFSGNEAVVYRSGGPRSVCDEKPVLMNVISV